MTAGLTPPVATWLLKRALTGPKAESLIGDLVERYQHGRSRFWFWRQALRAILMGATGDLLAHKWTAVRALLLGLVIYFGSTFPVTWLNRSIGWRIDTWLYAVHDYSPWWPSLIDGARNDITIYAACAASGWIVARLHRAHAAGALGLFAMTVLFFVSGHTVRIFWQYGHPPVPVVGLVLPAVFAMGRPVAILIGGLYEMRPGRLDPATML